ncbi:MAG TPA: hypothetical protein VMG12_39765 [Polyangiaceae bacterium]|nr:hypothetical protein [Polyangiaceae bacterium]
MRRPATPWSSQLIAVAVIGSVLACGGTTESVSRDVCVSGTRWTGGSSSDPEMSPGRDCLACHVENDGPPLVAAGTVYAVADNTSQIENDCFGLEGVSVELEGADGRLFQTTTNRAGNFYFDGYPVDLVKPYVARLSYTAPDGRVVSPQMVVTEPYYGGCAHCHDNRAATTPELDITDPGFARPVQGLFVQY